MGSKMYGTLSRCWRIVCHRSMNPQETIRTSKMLMSRLISVVPWRKSSWKPHTVQFKVAVHCSQIPAAYITVGKRNIANDPLSLSLCVCTCGMYLTHPVKIAHQIGLLVWPSEWGYFCLLLGNECRLRRNFRWSELCGNWLFTDTRTFIHFSVSDVCLSSTGFWEDAWAYPGKCIRSTPFQVTSSQTMGNLRIPVHSDLYSFMPVGRNLCRQKKSPKKEKKKKQGQKFHTHRTRSRKRTHNPGGSHTTHNRNSVQLLQFSD